MKFISQPKQNMENFFYLLGTGDCMSSIVDTRDGEVFHFPVDNLIRGFNMKKHINLTHREICFIIMSVIFYKKQYRACFK